MGKEDWCTSGLWSSIGKLEEWMLEYRGRGYGKSVKGVRGGYLGSCRNSGANGLAFRGGRLGVREVYKRGWYPHAEEHAVIHEVHSVR